MIYGWWTRLAGFAPAGLVAACLATPPAANDPPAARAEATLNSRETAAAGAAAPDPIDWSHGDCLSLLRRLQQAARDGTLRPEDSPPFALELVRPPGSWLDAVPDLPIEADLPLAADLPTDGAARCMVRIGPARDLKAAHRAVDVQDVRSVYQSGLRRETNPDYEAAKRALREAKDDSGGPRVVDVDDPLLDLIGTTVGGLIGALDHRSQQHQIDDAEAALAATPRSLDQPVYRAYSFERVVMRAQKQALVPVALLDGHGRVLRRTELRQSERREFFVLHGLDARDRDYEQHRSTSMTRADLARWTRTPPTLRLSAVALALTEDDAPAGNDATMDASEPWPDDPASTTPSGEDGVAEKEPMDPWRGPASDGVAGAPDPAAVVAVRAGKASGSGFYVRRDLVLTTYELVGSTSVVDVTTADGTVVPALVASADPTHNLALLHVPRPGPALVLDEGGAPAPARPIGASGPGRPVMTDGKVVGMSTGVAASHGDVVPVDAIRAFLDRQAGVLAAIP